MIRFNDTTQHFDAYLVMEEGNAITSPQRVIFNSQFSQILSLMVATLEMDLPLVILSKAIMAIFLVS